MEKIGVPKRQILIDRVKDAQAAQQEVQRQFTASLDQLSLLSGFESGDLETAYTAVTDSYKDSEDAAADLSKRINKIEDVADVMFEEWEEELNQYTSLDLQVESRNKLRQTQADYKQLLVTMRSAEAKMDPVLAGLRDNMLYLKHNLNTTAVKGLEGEFGRLQTIIKQLINEMNAAIVQSDDFIYKLKQ
ncbi:MAG: DUF2959 family protein [Psychromonas sp.]